MDCDPVISIIDDDAPTRIAVAALMRAKGFNTLTYDCAEDFLRESAHVGSQCIITDIFMPGLNGIELKQRLDRSNCVVPVIMMTARLEDRLRAQAIACGAFCLLQKPFKANALITCVEKALSGRH